MRGLLEQLLVTLRLHFRNRMGLLYGYLFPVVFLAAFWVLYRYDEVPLVRHMGELLTVTVLGGACFGLPTTLVSERERGVWRRYRLAPVSIGALVAAMIVGRYFILLTAGLLQLALAMAAGMPLPQHPVGLWVAFTCASFAFLGLGLVLAAMADNVPAVQALGQCIFLPMLIIGGVAVPLYVLPEWAQHVSAFFPGRYAVEAIQNSVTGDGLAGATFSLFALLVIGAASVVAGAMMFRWDAQQQFAAGRGKAWIVLALGAWVGAGLLAEADNRVLTRPAARPSAAVTRVEPEPGPGSPPATPVLTPQERAAATKESKPQHQPPSTLPPSTPKPPAKQEPTREERSRVEPRPERAPSDVPPSTAVPPVAPPASPPVSAPVEPWRGLTMDDIARPATFAGLPPDEGVVTPMAPADEEPDPLVVKQLEHLRDRLLEWEPALVEDPVQRVRNYLYVAVVPDMFQIPIERYVPWIVLERLQEEFNKEELVKLLYWVARRPYDGDESAIDQLRPLGLQNGPDDVDELRRRTSIYARKLLKRVLEG